jgi:hypothetical protein
MIFLPTQPNRLINQFLFLKKLSQTASRKPEAGCLKSTGGQLMHLRKEGGRLIKTGLVAGGSIERPV